MTWRRALVQVLNGDYAPKSSSYVQMPPIDVGPWSDVHLPYRRWLAVEDSHFDQARLTVGGQQAWINFTANMGDPSSTQHIDREWRFQDVPVSGYQPGHILDIAWDLTSDEGLQFGGSALDEVCVVANVNSACCAGGAPGGALLSRTIRRRTASFRGSTMGSLAHRAPWPACVHSRTGDPALPGDPVVGAGKADPGC